MNNFLKYTLATVLGIVVFSTISFLIFLGLISAISASSSDEESIKENSYLHIKFNKQINDRSSDNPFEDFNFSTFESENSIGLNTILKNIDKAKTDDNIKGIYLDLSAIPTGIATVEEIRNALIDFKESGKFIYTYAEVLTQGAYYLASVSDKIYMHPAGLMELKGLSAQISFYKNALEKLGVEPVIFRHGKFKSAIEPFMLDKMSDANKEQTSTFIQSIWDHLAANIEKSRDLSSGTVDKYANAMTIRNPQAALDNGIIDGLRYKDEVIAELIELTGVATENDLKPVTLSKYSKVTPEGEKKKSKRGKKDKIAVVYASGEIHSGKGRNNVIGSETISKAIHDACKDSSVKAIVLRVNSPGGSALASDVIWREAVLAQKVKPFIVSMGDVAASGGYYISCPADVILASEVTITGSIGVFGLMFNTQKLMTEKIGITFDGIKTNAYADLPSMTRNMTASEKEIIQHGVEDVYDTFIGHVGEGRKMTKESVDSIGQGRVWSGANAKEIGLIDEFGGLKRAIDIAVEKAGIENYKIVDYPKTPDPIEEIIRQLGGNIKMNIIQNELGENYLVYKKLKSLMNLQGVQARMPYEVDIH